MKRMFASIALALIVPALAWSQDARPPVVFLLDASLSANQDAFPKRVAQLKKMIETDDSIKKFNVLAFDVAGRWLQPKGFVNNDAEGRKSIAKQLDELAAEGACNLGAAFDRLATPVFGLEKGAKLRVVLLSEGQVFLGETSPARLARSLRSRSPYVLEVTCLAEKQDGGNAALFQALQAPAVNQAPLNHQEAFDAYLADIGKQVKLFEGKHGELVQLLVKALAEKDLAMPDSPRDDKLSPPAKAYLDARTQNLFGTDIYLEEAKRRGEAKDSAGLARALTSLIPLHPANPDVSRSVGYRLLDAKENVLAVHLFERIQRQRPDDPHSYRDLARALGDAERFGLAAIQYEIVLAGNWNNKYAGSMKEVAQEEYAHMMRDAIRRKLISNKLIDVFGERLEGFDSKKLQADLRVTISWNTDATDVDLWVIEPGGEKCFYGHQKTSNGGELTQDIVNGYGPERYQMIKAKPGEYTIAVHFFSGPRNAQVVEGTHVNVVVRRNAGTPQEVSQRFTVILRRQNDLVEVVRMKF